MANFSDPARALLNFAQEEALSLHYIEIEPEHFLLGLLRVKEGRGVQVLHALTVDENELYQRIRAALVTSEQLPEQRSIGLSEGSKRVITRIVQENKLSSTETISSAHFLSSLLQEEEGLGPKMLREAGVTLEAVRAQLSLPNATSEPTKAVQEAAQHRKRVARLRNYVTIGWLCVLLALFFLFVHGLPQTGLAIAHVVLSLLNAAPFLLAQPRPEWTPWLALLAGISGFLLWFILILPLYWTNEFLFPRLLRKTKTKVLPAFFRWFSGYCIKNALRMFSFLISLEAIYACFIFFPSSWWLWSTIYAMLFFLIFSYIRPFLLFAPLYKITPITDGPLWESLQKLLKQTGTYIDGLYLMEAKGKKSENIFMSANVFMLNWGYQKRILLTDYVYHKFPVDEVEVILAHELGHLVHRDIPKRAIVRALLLGLGLWVSQFFVQIGNDNNFRLFHLLGSIAADPFRFLYITYFVILGFYFFYQWLHRRDEYRADEYALEVTKQVEVFKRGMTRLSQVNLLSARHSKAQTLASTHPSLAERLKHADDFARKSALPGV